EVVVAMTIVGLAVVTLLEIFSLGLRLAARSTAATEAMVYGREVMDEFLSRPRLDEGSEQGSIPGKGRWKIQVRTLHDPANTVSLGSDWELREVGLDMSMLESGRERRVELKTFRLMK